MKPGDVDIADPTNVVRFEGPPNEYYAVLRREAPVFFNELTDASRRDSYPGIMRRGFWVLTKHADVDAASKDSHVFSSNVGGPVLWDLEGEPGLEVQRAGMMGMDRPEHARFRKLVSAGFKPRAVLQLEPKIQERVTQIVDAVASAGQCDFVMDLAWELPLTVMCEFMGVPLEDRQNVFEWSTTAATPEVPGRTAEAHQAAVMGLAGYGLQIADAKRKEPDDTLMSVYANSEVDGERLTDVEIAQFFTTLSIAGHETTRNTSNHLMRLLSENPEQKELVQSDIDTHLPNAIDEAMRHSPPVMQFRRTLREDIELRGSQLKAGDKIYLSYVSANRDEEVFENPEQFDVTRENASDHLAFGIGTHYCMGAQLARLQLRVLFKEILTRLPDIRVASEPERLPSIWFNAIQKMEVSYTPA